MSAPTRTKPTRLFAAVLLACLLAGCSDAQEQPPPKTYPNYSAEGQAIMQRQDLTQAQKDNILLAERDFVNAPPAARSIALRMALGEVPSQDELKALGDDISRAFPNPVTFNRNLLIAAAEYKNASAVDQLLAAGADPYRSIDPLSEKKFRYWNFVFRMTEQRGEWIENEHRFDYTYANELLMIYIKHGGNINYRGLLGEEPLILNMKNIGNSKGFKILLDKGADILADGRKKGTSILMQISTSGIDAYQYISFLTENGSYDKLNKEDINTIIIAARRFITTSIAKTPSDKERPFYEYNEYYSESIRKLIERVDYRLSQSDELYKILYSDR